MAISARSNQPEREFAFTERDFRFLVKLVGTKTGIVLGDHKRDMVYARLARRLRALGIKDFAAYCDYVQSDSSGDEAGQLVNAITTNLTRFFREPHHFEHLREQLIELDKSGARRLRIWSAACSSGMEPYSIAMVVESAIPALAGWDARILATDIDTNMLRTGIAGEYAESEKEHIPVVHRAALRSGSLKDTFIMPDTLKRLIAFKPLNLLEAWPMRGPFDAIFCRNVVIYFDKATQKTLFARMADMLKPGGILYLGHSESLHNVSDRFTLIGRTIYQKAGV